MINSDLLKEAKRLSKEFGFNAGTLKGALTKGREKACKSRLKRP